MDCRYCDRERNNAKGKELAWGKGEKREGKGRKHVYTHKIAKVITPLISVSSLKGFVLILFDQFSICISCNLSHCFEEYNIQYNNHC